MLLFYALSHWHCISHFTPRRLNFQKPGSMKRHWMFCCMRIEVKLQMQNSCRQLKVTRQLPLVTIVMKMAMTDMTDSVASDLLSSCMFKSSIWILYSENMWIWWHINICAIKTCWISKAMWAVHCNVDKYVFFLIQNSNRVKSTDCLYLDLLSYEKLVYRLFYLICENAVSTSSEWGIYPFVKETPTMFIFLTFQILYWKHLKKILENCMTELRTYFRTNLQKVSCSYRRYLVSHWMISFIVWAGALSNFMCDLIAK